MQLTVIINTIPKHAESVKARATALLEGMEREFAATTVTVAEVKNAKRKIQKSRGQKAASNGKDGGK